MKIRILDNSIRLRISQSEMNDLNESGSIQRTMNFQNGNRFKYGLYKSGTNDLTAEMKENEIRVLIPISKVEELVHTDLIGVEEDSRGLKVLVEKDFKCLNDREEDESDLFENPLAGEETC